jgi:hypothetical protein
MKPKPNRYARRAMPRAPRPALSPRVPVKLTHSEQGSGGLAVSGGANQAATVGQANAGNGARRPAGNTMRNARMGGQGITYYDPAELARESLTHANAHAPARTANRPYSAATYADTLAAAESEGIRQAAMARHSILRTNGAIDVLPRTGPVWSDDPTDD